MYLAEKLQPDFRTISDFRKENEQLIEEAFKNTVKAAKDLGVIGLEQLSTEIHSKSFCFKKQYCYKRCFGNYWGIRQQRIKKDIEVEKMS